jgi:integrase
MPSIEERPTPEGKPGYRVKVRLAGAPTQSATFSRLTDANRWAQSTEAAIREGRYFKAGLAKKHTVAQLIDKYIAEIPPIKPPHAQTQKYQLIWWKQQLGHLTLAHLTAPEIGKCRDKLLAHQFRPGKTTTAATVVRYLAALSHALSTAVKDWEWLDDCPMRKVRKPKKPRGRTRTLTKGEVQSLLTACKSSKNRHLYLVTLLAVSTGPDDFEVTETIAQWAIAEGVPGDQVMREGPTFRAAPWRYQPTTAGLSLYR